MLANNPCYVGKHSLLSLKTSHFLPQNLTRGKNLYKIFRLFTKHEKPLFVKLFPADYYTSRRFSKAISLVKEARKSSFNDSSFNILNEVLRVSIIFRTFAHDLEYTLF